MNTSELKSYAPEARRNFMAAVAAQAARLGITADGIASAQVQGDVLLVNGQPFPRAIAATRRRLAERVQAHGFHATMEAIAYTWFNRFVAIRYMELHGYLGHGYRVLSHPDGQPLPEILTHAAEVDLPGLNRETVISLKLDGTRDEALYHLLLLAQCNALHEAMPFLFEKIGDESELLLPANLLHSDSLIRQLVEGIDEAAWSEIEIIGWLYQFYISEKKDAVIGKVVASEDIPAATQLFTPNWIVKYMVQNSLGAQWLATYPHSPLKAQMDYYIEPAEQTDEVNAQLAAITPASLNPEELTLIDPACGSGHILVEAYELFKAIYLERGYRQRDVPQLILEKNLFGLDIDERAAQLSGFALMMKGRADDRQLFERGVQLNVMALQDSAEFRMASAVWRTSDEGWRKGLNAEITTGIEELIALFEHATTFGSLIQVPAELAEKLPALKRLSERTSSDLFVTEALKQLGPLVRQAEMLAQQYDAVVANPPYMGSNYHEPPLKRYLNNYYKGYEKDLFSAFICRNEALAKEEGRSGYMTPMVWMFISSHEVLRGKILNDHTLNSVIQLEYNASGAVRVPLCTFVISKSHITGNKGSYIRLEDFPGERQQGLKTLEAIRNPNCGWLYTSVSENFKKIPGSPVAYWVSDQVFKAFESNQSLSQFANPNQALVTGNTNRYIRFWWEVGISRIGFGFRDRKSAKSSGLKWFPYNKGGPFRNWYGNCWFVLNWENDGHELRTTKHPKADRIWAHNFVLDQIFKEAVVWAKVTSSRVDFRYSPGGFLYDDASGVCPSISNETIKSILAFLVTPVAETLAKIVSPTLNMQPGDLGSLPYAPAISSVKNLPSTLVNYAREDWNCFQHSWDFQMLPILKTSSDSLSTLESSYTVWITQNRETIGEMKDLEEENNRIFIEAYGLQDELSPEVPIERITLTVNPAYRYGKKVAPDAWSVNHGFGEELETRFRQDTMEELVSYAIGCMMGRYRLDQPGLIYAHAGNVDFWKIYGSVEGRMPNAELENDIASSNTRHPALDTRHFQPDEDGIIPLTDIEWFADDACNRLIEFISVAWPAVHLEANLTFLADNLGPKKNESNRETIRRWLNDKFFKDHHLKRYKKRPIYWLFTSGKQKAFQCLVYLHRYNEATLARMRSEYVIPLQGKMAAHLEKLAGDIEAATSSAHQKRLEKEKAKLKIQQAELLTFDEKLRHYADRRIKLDLDDGVKVNYGKFGDLLAEVKKVHGKKVAG